MATTTTGRPAKIWTVLLHESCSDLSLKIDTKNIRWLASASLDKWVCKPAVVANTNLVAMARQDTGRFNPSCSSSTEVIESSFPTNKNLNTQYNGCQLRKTNATL
ncbi:hypothetical protein Tco_1136122 [Tanacetum coccineum]